MRYGTLTHTRLLTVMIAALLATAAGACAADTGTPPDQIDPAPPSRSSTGLRTVTCTTLASHANTQWATMPKLPGLDVKLFYQTVFHAAEVTFRNRYQDTVHFSAEVYPYGMSPAPETTGRFSLRAGHVDNDPIGFAGRYSQSVGLGGQACVVIDQVRFGPSDSGPYFNP